MTKRFTFLEGLPFSHWCLGIGHFLLLGLAPALGETNVQVERLPTDASGFTFKEIPPPARNDAAAKATISILRGERDGNGGPISKLNDGRLPIEADQPSQNFFFRAGGEGGRLLIDLGKVVNMKAIRTYSRHTGNRAPQVYEVYGAEGTPGFDPKSAQGWARLAKVDTRSQGGGPGGTHGVSIAGSAGSIGRFRYIALEVAPTKDGDIFAHTFFSEIDVVDADAPEPDPAEEAMPPIVLTSPDGKYRFSIDCSLAPDLAEWAEKGLGPVVLEWYPKIVQMLPSKGFEAAKRVAIEFRDDMGGTPAYAAGSRVSCNVGWFRKNLEGEARGAVVHELVHVVQQYGRARRTPNATRAPGWIVEGIPDYIRWFLYEPQTGGAHIPPGNAGNVSYDASYRVTANFINWVTARYDKELPRKLNAAARDGRYTDAIWKELTGKPVQQLGDEWKKAIGPSSSSFSSSSSSSSSLR